MHNGSVCEKKRKSEYRKGATYKYALLKAKSLDIWNKVLFIFHFVVY